MSSDRDTTRIVRTWLEDGANVLPDRVLDSVLDQLPVTPQRRRWWQAWRNPFAMNTMRLALAAGVVVLATVAGLGVYFNQGDLIGPQPTPVQSPTPTIEPTPTPLSFSELGSDQPVEAGTYLTDTGFPLRMVFDVPQGWAKWIGDDETVAVYWNRFNPPNGAALGFTFIGDVYSDPCRWTTSLTEVGPTVDDLAEALADRPNVAATSPVDVTLAGYAGKYLELTVPDDVSHCDDGEFRHWESSSGRTGRDDPYGGDRDRVWILDVEGARLVIGAAYQPNTPEEVLSELQQMVDSIRIEPPGAQTPTAEQTPHPSPSPVPRFGADGRNVPAGTYLTGSLFPLDIEFTVPAGWQSWSVAHDGVGVSKYGAGPPAGSGFGFWIVGEVYPDPCARLTNGPVDPGPSVDDLAGALQNLENYQTTAPIDVSLGGYSGKYLEITAPADLTLSGCEAADPRLWRTEGLGVRSVYGPEEHDRIWILDVEGTRLLVKMAYRPGTPESDVAELEQMVDSIRIRAPETSAVTTVQAPGPSPSPLSFSRIGGIAGADVPAGTYVTDFSFPLQIQFTVPEGWQRWTEGSEAVGLYKHGGERPSGSRFGFWIIEEISADPCDGPRGAIDPGPTVEDLANALAGLPNWNATAPADVSLGGFSGKYLEMTPPADLSGCVDDLRFGAPSLLGHRIGPGSRFLVWILDVDDTRLVVATSSRPPTPESDVDELRQMVDSIVIQP